METSGVNDPLRRAITRLLGRVRAGDRAAFDELIEILYEELKYLAGAQRRGWHGADTLNTTALVHEAYEKLAAQDKPAWASRAHFRSAAARAMRQILVDYSRAQRAAKRGGGLARVSLDELRALDSGATFSGQHTETLLALDESLTRLAAIDERQTRVVECRFFGGMTIQETAESLRISAATVQRDWAMAKAWLYRDMQRASGSSAEQQVGGDKGMGRTSRGGSPPLG